MGVREDTRESAMDALMDLERENPKQRGFSAAEVAARLDLLTDRVRSELNVLANRRLVVVLYEKAGPTRPAARYCMARTKKVPT